MSRIFSEKGKVVTNFSLQVGNTIFMSETDEYQNKKFSSQQINEEKKGEYALTNDDALLIQVNTDLFWAYLKGNSVGVGADFDAISKIIGLTKDSIKNKVAGAKLKIFSMEKYKNTPLTDTQKNNLAKGVYEVTELDKEIFKNHKDIFWNRLYKDSSDKSINEEARKGVGLSMTSLEGDSIFVATTLGIKNITVSNKPGVTGSVSSTNKIRLQIIGLYANHLVRSNSIRTILISDVARTPDRQAEYVYNDALLYPNISDTNTMYAGKIGELARKLIKDNVSPLEITTQLTNYITTNGTFRHVNNSGNTVDIAANDTRDTSKNEFLKSFAQFMKANTWIISNNSLMKGGDGGETNAHHTVFK